jgi:hypothetical protein
LPIVAPSISAAGYSMFGSLNVPLALPPSWLAATTPTRTTPARMAPIVSSRPDVKGERPAPDVLARRPSRAASERSRRSAARRSRREARGSGCLPLRVASQGDGGTRRV